VTINNASKLNLTEVKIRPVELSDKEQIALLANNKKVWDNLRDYMPFPYTQNDALQYINLSIKDQSLHNFAIEYQGELCGMIGLIIQSDVYRKSAELGYWIGEPYWGKGIATKAVELITILGFNKLNLIRIQAGVFDFNIASMKVLEKNGYHKEGVAKQAVIKNNIACDEHRYAILNKHIN